MLTGRTMLTVLTGLLFLTMTVMTPRLRLMMTAE